MLFHQYCKICQEPFEQYWDEDDEAWMLRDAMKVNDKTYHPTCFEDLKNVSKTPLIVCLTQNPRESEREKGSEGILAAIACSLCVEWGM